MNSLTELNTYAAALSLDFTDLRAPGLVFDSVNAVNQSQSVDEGFPFLSTIGIEITEIINSDISLPAYTIDVRALPGTTVSWTTLPSGLTIDDSIDGVYKVLGLSTVDEWDDIKQATITLPANYAGVWTYTSVINYYSGIEGNSSKAWTTAVTVNDVQFLTTPLDFTYNVSEVTAIVGFPQLSELDASYDSAVWTVVGTPSSNVSINTWTSSGTGGTFSVNGSKAFTIVGTRTQVNSRLAGLTIDANSINLDFVLTYAASNNLNSTTDSKIQILSSSGLVYLGSPTVAYFNEDAAQTSVSGFPPITDTIYDGSGGYIYTITPSPLEAVVSLSIVSTASFNSYNAETKTLTINGTRSAINTDLATLRMITAVDWGTDFTLNYNVVTPRFDTANKIQALLCGTNDTEISNMNVTRTYIGNRGNQIFNTTTPFISDLDTSSSTYTIAFSVSDTLGGFSFDINSQRTSSLTYSGTRAECNAKFAGLYFWPNKDVSSNGTFTYTQFKNSVQQITQTVSLQGTAGTYNNARQITFLAGQSYTPDISDVLYADFDLFLLGGGGGGGNIVGGGGGEIKIVRDLSLTSATTYTLTIGQGGAPATKGGTTSAFGYSAEGGNVGTGGGSADAYRGLAGGSVTTTSGITGGGGGGAGGSGTNMIPLGFPGPNGQNANISSGYGGRGGVAGYYWDWPDAYYSAYASGGGGGSTAFSTATARGNAGRGASQSNFATNGTEGWGSGGGGGATYIGRSPGSGGSGRIIIRFFAK